MAERMIPRNLDGDCGATNVTVNCGAKGGGGTSFPEAPLDGKLYGRKNAAWSEVPNEGGSGSSGIPEAPEDGKLYGRKDKEWEEVAGGGFDGEHDDLTGIKGEGTFHLSEDTARWAENAAMRRPQRPHNLYPVDGEYDVDSFVRFVGSNYYQADGVPMSAMQLEISKGGTVVFDPILFQSMTSHELAGTELKPNETGYSWRIRYQTVENQWSEWSEATAFKTQSLFEETSIAVPTIMAPLEGGSVAAKNAVLLSSPFKYHGQATTHQSSSWRINTQRDGQGADLWRLDNSATSLTSAMVDIDLYSAGAERMLYAGVQHKAANGKESRWSPSAGFRLRPYHSDPVIGIEFTSVGGAMVVRHIDLEGNYVTPSPSYFDQHPLYAGLSTVYTPDSNPNRQMSLILPTFVKCETVGNAHRIWIAPSEFSGSHLHPAFRKGAGNGFYFGRYLSSSPQNDGLTSIASSYGGRSSGGTLGNWSVDINQYLGAGWSASTLYQESIVRLLLFIEACSPDPSLKFGYGSSVSDSLGTASTSSRWRGIFFLWNATSSWSFLNLGVSLVADGEIKLGIPENPASLVSIGFNTPSVGVYVEDILSGYNTTLGLNYEYLFLPKTTTATAPGSWNATMGAATGGIANGVVAIGGNTLFKNGIASSGWIMCRLAYAP